METALSKFNHRQLPHPLSLHHHRPSISRPISSLSFSLPSPPPLSSLTSSSLSLPIRASLTSSSSLSNPKNPKPQLIQSLNPHPFSLLRTTLIAAVTTTVLIFARFNIKPVIAAPLSSPPEVEESSTVSDEEREKNLEEFLNSHPDDVQALRNLMELKIKNKKVEEAVKIIDQLTTLDPEDTDWPLLKSHLYYYSGNAELAKVGFNEILSKDPLRVEAYHGLVMAASQDDDDSTGELKEVEKRIREGIEMVKKENKKEDLRDFMLLLAQVRVMEGDYNDALEIYEELAKEKPGDFRPYLCQGIIYTLLRKTDEADKNFQKYKRLVPEGHPYAQYFDEDLIATKLFSQKKENERARAKN